MSFTVVAQPTALTKITAAGFGDQVHDAVAELQAWAVAVDPTAAPGVNGLRTELDADLLHLHADPGALADGAHTTVTAAAVGTSTIVAAPSSGTRVLKAITIHAPTALTTVTLQVGGVTAAVLGFTDAGEATWGCTVPIVAGETVQATVAGAAARITTTWVDRADTALARYGPTSTTGTATLLTAPGGADRTVTQLWIAAAAGASAATVSVGGSAVRQGLAMTSSGLLVASSPLVVPAGQTLQVAGDGVTAVTFTAAAY